MINRLLAMKQGNAAHQPSLQRQRRLSPNGTVGCRSEGCDNRCNRVAPGFFISAAASTSCWMPGQARRQAVDIGSSRCAAVLSGPRRAAGGGIRRAAAHDAGRAEHARSSSTLCGSADMSAVALLSKHAIIIANKRLGNACTVHETIRVKVRPQH